MRAEWSESELETLAKAAYRGLNARCPVCGTAVTFEILYRLGQAKAGVFLACRRCGAHGDYEPSEGVEPQWTTTQRNQIVNDYWATGTSSCPLDEARLHFEESKEIGPGPRQLFVQCPACGNTIPPYVADEPPETSFEGCYEVLETIGRGGAGEVLLVRRRQDRGIFAAKRLASSALADEEQRVRFAREARLLAELDHPNVLRLIEVFAGTGPMVVVMEHMAGGDLDKVLSRPDVEPRTLARYFAQAARGLEHLHSKGIVHRDLKPSNILLAADGRAVLADFGIARFPAKETTTWVLTDGPVGTVAYSAPEQLRNESEIGPAADIYSLGQIALKVAARAAPSREITGRLAGAIRAALAHSPDERTISPSDLAAALTEFLEG